MTNNRTTPPAPVQDSNAELEALRARIAELEEKKEKPEEEDFRDVKIQQDDFISVMSLLPYNLNLSTRMGGQGNVKKFTKFGEVKKIMYGDLINILEVNSNFLNAGYFYIMNPALIRHHGLGEVYSKILTKEKIEEILASNSDECLTLYSSANEKQQEIIVELLIERVFNNPDSVNLNIVDKISRASKVDISKRAEEMREASAEAEK